LAILFAQKTGVINEAGLPDRFVKLRFEERCRRAKVQADADRLRPGVRQSLPQVANIV
jgi:hypothetical protein